MTKNGGLTPKQEAFCLAYVETSRPSEAYRRAYDAGAMKPTTIKVKAQELLNNPTVAARVKEMQAGLETMMQERFALTRERLAAEIGKMAYANMDDYMTVQGDGTAYVDLSNITREQAAAISEITVEEYIEGRGEDARAIKRVKLKLHPKLGAVELGAKVVGMLTNKHEHTGKDGAPLVPEHSDRDVARVILSILSQAQIAKEDTPQ